MYVALSPRVTGFIVIEPAAADRHPAHDRAEAMEISMLFVHPSTQRKGIGTALLRHVCRRRSRARVSRVQVWTGTDNPQAQQFYRSLAMIPTGRRVQGAGSPESADER